MDLNIFENDHAWKKEWHHRQQVNIKRCVRCLYTEATPRIQFNDKFVCNYCSMHDQLMMQYQSDDSRRQFDAIIEKIRVDGKNKPYDVIVGVSGGVDSSYMLYLSKSYGLRPLAVHFDNTWNSTIAVNNIHKLLSSLKIDLNTHIVSNHEYDDLYRSILESGVPDLEIPTDLGLAATLNITAAKYKIKYIFEGHSFLTEGIAPFSWPYMDAKYLNSIHQQYGKIKKLDSYPYFWFSKQLKWMLWNGLKKIRPFWYLNYQKEDAKKLLQEKFNWEWYGGHHLENRITNFYQTYFLPRRFNRDYRLNGYSAMIRSGQMNRSEALEIIKEPPICNPELVALVKKRLGYSDEAFVNILSSTKKTYRDFKSYKPLFEKLSPFFYIMAKLNYIPMSFYLKYTKKD